jgi:hypothetical protein
MGRPEPVALDVESGGEPAPVDGPERRRRHRPMIAPPGDGRAPIPRRATGESGAGRVRRRISVRSVQAARVAADIAVGDATCGIHDEIARAAVRAAVGSVGGCGAATETAHCDRPARDRRGGGSRSHSNSLLVARLAGVGRSTRRCDRFPGSTATTHVTGASVS